nr:Cna B-type domain-containing protein [Vagococcus hydrophili]
MKVYLLANGEKQGEAIELNSGSKWTKTWNNLPKKSKGKDIKYSIEEVKISEYEVAVDDKDQGNIMLKNTYTSKVKKNTPNTLKKNIDKILPKTGEKDNIYLELIGIVLFVVASLKLYFIRKS